MTRIFALVCLTAGCLEMGAVSVSEDDLANGPDGGHDDQLSFFVTSHGNDSSGGNFGGLVGADNFCQIFADGVGSSRTWAAYLSTVPITGVPGTLVHARDRIGTGPWYNANGELVAADVDAFHATTLAPSLLVDEGGNPVPNVEHDILTGSLPDGHAREEFPGNPVAPAPTCLNWTSNQSDSYAWVGHADADVGIGDIWTSSHETTCDASGLASTAGSGRLYCFAID